MSSQEKNTKNTKSKTTIKTTSKSRIKVNGGRSATSVNKTSAITLAKSVDTIEVPNNDDQDPIRFLSGRGYRVIKPLGEGAFATVFKAQPIKPTNESVKVCAIKVFDLTNQTNKLWVEKCLKNEMYISKNLHHPNIIFTFDVYKTRRNGYIIMQFAGGGDLSERMYNKLKRPYTEEETKKYFKSLMAGLEYMHGANVTHRDLKLENFLLTEQNIPLLSDFGFSAQGIKHSGTVLSKLMRNTLCGSPGYMAPEVASGSHYDSKAVDIFAMGVSLFEMFNMAQPYPPNAPNIMQKIIRQDYRFQVVVPTECRELIASMLCVDPGRRPNAEEVVHSNWLDPSLLRTFAASLGFLN